MKKALVGLVAALAVCGAAASGVATAAEKKLVVGSKEFTEQRLLGHLMIALLEKNGFQVEDKTGLGGTLVARQALVNGQIDVYMEYTGTGLITHLKHKKPITDPAECYRVTKEEDEEKNRLVWLPYVPFNNTYCLMMRRADADKLGIRTISDLSRYVKANPQAVSFGINAEFYARPDGYRPLQKKYGFRFPADKIVKMDSGLLYKALRDGEVQVSMGFATDGRIKGFDLVVLEDDLQYFPVYNPAPVVRLETAERYPELAQVFAPLTEKLDTAAMTALNYQVDIEHKPIPQAARDWLKSVGLL
ncbi:MAG: glycine betaine ABC transporter substrate-binding protein [Deferrisomatales bacterium]